MKVLGKVAVVIALAGAVLLLRAATMSTDTDPVPGSSTTVVVETFKQREPAFTLEEVTQTLVTTCRITVDAVILEPVTPLGERTFRFQVFPALNASDWQQFSGCLEDARLDHVILDVVSMQTSGVPAER